MTMIGRIEIATTALVSGTLSALGIMGWQSYTWLRSGEWPSVSVLHVLGKIDFGPSFLAWRLDPQEWIGIHKALDWLPMSGTCWAAGLFVLWLSLIGEK